jgi:hypothetical protein
VLALTALLLPQAIDSIGVRKVNFHGPAGAILSQDV